MKTIEERAKEYASKKADISLSDVYNEALASIYEEAYIAGAKEQKAIDEEVRLKKCDDMTKAEYDREVAFADWYHKNGNGTPTFSDALEWARRELIDEAHEKVRKIANEYFGDWEQSGKVEDTFRNTMDE